ncbi:MAG: ZIP family metal transporter [Candidatus Nomurabacteria bacterium]|jgi:zinc and cadmium transporter|nr:ZIP family metal transporter [Candidatus Nomurabacteria bacterium]
MIYVVVFSAAAALLSLVGGVILMMRKDCKRLAGYAAAFAAGALLATVAFDLLPHLAHEAHDEGDWPFAFVLVGILLFFVIELVLNHLGKGKHLAAMVVIGDTVHNIIDGAVIAAGFLVSVPSGIIVVLTVIAHELPQEVGDAGLLLHSGVGRKKTILLNVVSALFTVAAAAVAFAFGSDGELSASWLLGLASGFFLYIAFHVLLEIHHADSRKTIWQKTGWLFAGLVIVALTIMLLGQH